MAISAPWRAGPQRGRQRVVWRGWLFSLRGHAAEGDQERTLPAAEAKARQFEAFFYQFDRQIAGYLWRMTGDAQIVSELSQETFLRAWRNFDTIAGYDKPGAWLFRVATNLALQHRQRPANRQTAISLDLVDEPAGSDPGRHLVERDLVRQTLQALSPKLRAILVLREVYGFSCDEAGAALGMSPEAAKMAFWRAREQFRAIYLRKDGQE